QTGPTYRLLQHVSGEVWGVDLRTATPGVVLTSAELYAAEDLPLTQGKPPGVPFGMLGWRMTTPDVGGTHVITLRLPAPAPSGARWFFYDPQSGWWDNSYLGVVSSDRRSVALSVTDGGFGDLDGTANGVIVDPGGIGVFTAASGGDDPAGIGGGCTLAPAARGDGGPWLWLLLVLGGWAWRRWRF
ncbi:MAG: hypothetical protein H7831_14980, partial [Magnetococcus sp. WYHC-3]